VSFSRCSGSIAHNTIKYSGVIDLTVKPTATDRKVHLVVSDAGAGFDVETGNKNRRLGLVSVQERMHLIGGSLEIESRPGEGTKIFASVPLNREASELLTDIGADQAANTQGAV
jgi:signal transduction histidine kinase